MSRKEEGHVNYKLLLSEFIGTFALVFIGAGTGALGAGGLVGVALAHGLVLLVFIYAYGPISGTNINPAVTFGLALAGVINWSQAVLFWIAQFLGGIFAALLLIVVLGGTESGLGATVLAAGVTPLQGIILEAILTFFLVNSVFFTAVTGKNTNLAGLAIGLTLAFCILMGGPLTGASLNPARTLGPALFSNTLNLFWIYLVGTFLGAALAAGVFKVLNMERVNRPEEGAAKP